MVLALVDGAWENFGCRVRRFRIVSLSTLGLVCGHLVRPGSVHALLAEHRGRLFPDEMFNDLFPSRRGRPSVPADDRDGDGAASVGASVGA